MKADCPYRAAADSIGNGVTVKIERYKLDGTRCGMNTGRHAEWNWAYRVIVPGEPRSLWNDRGLCDARNIAACYGDTIVEVWMGGKTWKRGPKGGLSEKVAA